MSIVDWLRCGPQDLHKLFFKVTHSAIAPPIYLQPILPSSIHQNLLGTDGTKLKAKNGDCISDKLLGTAIATYHEAHFQTLKYIFGS